MSHGMAMRRCAPRWNGFDRNVPPMMHDKFEEMARRNLQAGPFCCVWLAGNEGFAKKNTQFTGDPS
jgi:hypothetical protein